jgi:hypothetical protein
MDHICSSNCRREGCPLDDYGTTYETNHMTAGELRLRTAFLTLEECDGGAQWVATSSAWEAFNNFMQLSELNRQINNGTYGR